MASLGAVAAASGQTPSVTCRPRQDAQGRAYRLAQRAEGGTPVWYLSMQSRASGNTWIDLSLPGAAPAFGDRTASLDFRNANGGRQIKLDVRPGAASLDVYVDYGLDVNIDPNLDPDVDRLNTGGPLTAIDCTVSLR
jgi:hypothetical protein